MHSSDVITLLYQPWLPQYVCERLPSSLEYCVHHQIGELAARLVETLRKVNARGKACMLCCAAQLLCRDFQNFWVERSRAIHHPRQTPCKGCMMNITRYFSKQPGAAAGKQACARPADVLEEGEIDQPAPAQRAAVPHKKGPANTPAGQRSFTSPGTPASVLGTKPASMAKRKADGQAGSDRQKLQRLLGDGETKSAESLKYAQLLPAPTLQAILPRPDAHPHCSVAGRCRSALLGWSQPQSKMFRAGAQLTK